MVEQRRSGSRNSRRESVSRPRRESADSKLKPAQARRAALRDARHEAQHRRHEEMAERRKAQQKAKKEAQKEAQQKARLAAAKRMPHYLPNSSNAYLLTPYLRSRHMINACGLIHIAVSQCQSVSKGVSTRRRIFINAKHMKIATCIHG